MNIPIVVNIPGEGLLSLAGSGEYLPAMRPVDRWLIDHLIEPPRVVCLATAAGTEGQERINYWDHLGERHFSGLGASVEALPVWCRGDAENELLAEKVRAANFVYLSGGKPNYLYQSLFETPVLEAILSVLEKGGVVAGCSAGAMVFGEKIASSPLNWTLREGFNLLPSVFIIPHYNEIPHFIKSGLPHVNRSLSLVGIEANTALVCSSRGCQALGAGSVYVSTEQKTTRYQGENTQD
ncbi:MAG: Type 1 glutamine amidotransferase-like domain-containing protein [Anaerolineaceae bacterium]